MTILLLIESAGAATLSVDDSGGADYKRIQDAINAASDGDTILVYSGTYSEYVNINKRLVLRGIDNGGGKPVVNAGGRDSAVTLSAGWSTIEGFTVTNSGMFGWYKDEGIKVVSNNNIIKNNNVLNSQDGISLYYSNNNILNGNTVSNNKDGIGVENSSNNTLSDNTVLNNNLDGIWMENSNNNTLSDNTASNNKDGIATENSNNNTLNGNAVSNNNENGIWMENSNNNVLSGNTASNNKDPGIWIENSNNNMLSDNTVSSNGGGVGFSNSNNNRVYHNNIINNHAYDDAINIWDNGLSGGNYWSDYTGIDANNDGIGDTPYNISDGAWAQDRYPLMTSYEGATLPLTPIPTLTPTPTASISPMKTPTVTPKVTPTSMDNKTLIAGETWNISEGYALTALGIDAKSNPKQVWLELSRNGRRLDDIVLVEGQTYTYDDFKTRIARIYSGPTAEMVTLTDSYIASASPTPAIKYQVQDIDIRTLVAPSYGPTWDYEIGAYVRAVSISSDGSYIAAGSEDKKIYLFNRKGKLLWDYETTYIVTSVSISSDGSYIAAGSQDNKVYFFNREGNLLWSSKTDNYYVNGVLVFSDGSNVLAWSGSYVYFFNREGKLLWSKKTGETVKVVSISSDGSFIAAGSGNKVYFFNKQGKLLWNYETDEYIQSISMSSDGSFIAAGTACESVSCKNEGFYFFNREGKLLWRYDNYFIHGVSVSSDGSYIAVGSSGGVLLLNKDGKVLWRYRSSDVNTIWISSDALYVVADVWGWGVYVFNLEGKLLRRYEDKADVYVKGVSISQDALSIATMPWNPKKGWWVSFFAESDAPISIPATFPASIFSPAIIGTIITVLAIFLIGLAIVYFKTSNTINKCSSCGKVVPSKFPYCAYCGTKLKRF